MGDELQALHAVACAMRAALPHMRAQEEDDCHSALRAMQNWVSYRCAPQLHMLLVGAFSWVLLRGAPTGALPAPRHLLPLAVRPTPSHPIPPPFAAVPDPPLHLEAVSWALHHPHRGAMPQHSSANS